MAAFAALAACDARQTTENPGMAEHEDRTASCNIPADLRLPSRANQPDRIPDPPTSGFALALSWSPEFCRFRGEVRKHRGQCQDNDFGFIVHGLWAQGPTGSGGSAHPRACALAAPITESLARAHYCMMPSTDLMQHEWAAHGTCAYESAEAYFEATRAIWSRLTLPDLRTLHPRGLTAGDVRQAFTRANPELPKSAIFVDVKNNGWLKEVRICLDLNLEPESCGRRRGAADSRPIQVWRGG